MVSGNIFTLYSCGFAASSGCQLNILTPSAYLFVVYFSLHLGFVVLYQSFFFIICISLILAKMFIMENLHNASRNIEARYKIAIG